ncbi:uncharacterized protein Z520_06829 [Fonsecaea multimorphosa CBS 102226]|uniref:Methyltransferase n=1 Tax=Fonsecaea multimorphosa CBS 102226 TaxID=1442371 RepID=A0A0D2JV67_9EURO|nr:uncharacterized protein Z520_06829 [Fonsecaea multimorphosa CBS 102226]KIX97377.1 hypothetical protein Z520_06829 [Fonsecaea multimorphosa CBS 102226]OAL23345.1 hypothetical protein AYO22_06395 [Fonsecaea multimorphosa]
MTEGRFKYIDPSSYVDSDVPFVKPWSKVDGPGYSFKLTDHDRAVENIRGQESKFSVDTSGFAVYNSPAQEKAFTDDAKVREGYYSEVEALLREKLPGVKKVVFFDHTIRRREKASPRQPVQQVHVDQTPNAAAVRVRRHLPAEEAEELLKGRYQIINIWRPIANPASDFPLAVIDYRTTEPSDMVKVDLLYPKRETNGTTNGVHDEDDRGKEVLPDPSSASSTAGYEVKGETFAVRPNDKHRFFYMKDMTPEEVMFIKCFDSYSEVNGGKKGIAAYTPHTAFVDPQTPADAPGRQSIEVRSLVFYE